MRNEGKWSCKDPMVFTLYIKILVRNYRQTKTLGATFTILDWEYMKDIYIYTYMKDIYIYTYIYTHIYIYIYTNIHTANEDVNMTAILALINITWAVVKIRPEKKNFRPAQFTKLFARGVWRTAWTAREEMSLYEDSKVLSLSLNSYQQK